MNTSTLKSTFDDEFNTFDASSTGSSALWQTSLGGNNRTLGSNGEEEYYSDSSVGVNPFSIQNGVLDITAKPGTNPLGLPYDSGAINTEHSFSQLYGYFEIDAEMPAGQGLWPAFWLLPESGAWPPELDVFEVLGNDPDTLYFSTHSSVQATQGTTLGVSNVSAGFNLYGVMWGPKTVDLYINNVEVASMPTPADMDVPMYMTANLAVGGYWPGDPNSTTPFPATMKINYVRAFAYAGTTGGTVTDNPSDNTGATTTSSSGGSTTTSSRSAPVVKSPAKASLAAGTTQSLAGISVVDSEGSKNLTVRVTDSTGVLHSSATTGVTEQGEGSNALTLIGSAAAINADLASLTYTAAGSTRTDWLWVSATDPDGSQGISSIQMTVTTASAVVASAGPGLVVAAPSSLGVAAKSTKSLSDISVANSKSDGNIVVIVSDSTGLLNAKATAGVTQQGAGSTALRLTGTSSAINAELATLTYTAKANSGTDWLWVSANVSSATSAPQAVSPVVVSISGSAAIAPSTDTVKLSSVMIGLSKSAGFVTATLSDSSGLLATASTPGVTATGENSLRLVLQGAAPTVIADLASLTYTGRATNLASGLTDTLHVSVTGSAGNQVDTFSLPLFGGHLAT